jgi:GNAT superfamily N-acetyltransferase
MASLEVVTSADRHDLDEEARAAFREVWPEFIFHDPVSAAHIERVEQYFPRFDVMLLADGEVVAGGWGVPMAWSGTLEELPEGYDGALVRSVEGFEKGVAADTLSVMAAAVKAGHQRGGYAGQVLSALRSRALDAGLSRVIAPVRPALKNKYPLTPMSRFASWRREDGMHIDPWIRTHERMGASILGPAPRSMVITGTIAEWSSWTEMAFPETGSYVVPDALDLVSISVEDDRGTYEETNLWMRHA